MMTSGHFSLAPQAERDEDQGNHAQDLASLTDDVRVGFVGFKKPSARLTFAAEGFSFLPCADGRDYGARSIATRRE